MNAGIAAGPITCRSRRLVNGRFDDCWSSPGAVSRWRERHVSKPLIHPELEHVACCGLALHNTSQKRSVETDVLAEIIDVIVFKLDAPVWRHRIFDAGAEQQAGQSGAAVLAFGGVGVGEGEFEASGGKAGFAIDEGAIDRDAGARGDIGVPAIARGDVAGERALVGMEMIGEAGPRGLALDAPDDGAGLKVAADLAAGETATAGTVAAYEAV